MTTVNREDVIVELKRVADLLGKDGFSRSEFSRHGTVSSGVVEKRFGTWNKAVEAAGLVPMNRFKRINDNELEQEFHRVYANMGKLPTRNEFAMETKFSPNVYEKRFGTWRKTVAHYLGQQVPTIEPPHRQLDYTAIASQAVPKRRPLPAALEASRGRRVFGPLLDFRQMRHAPVNEQGVVLLFGMLAPELGFLVEAVGSGFPDCKAKRRIAGDNYMDVEIEFEFRTTNFREHGHDPAGCDLVVCWEHNWPGCPVEVLELKTAIEGLPSHA